MIQDRALKARVLRYAVAKRWLPQLELDVLPRAATSEALRPLTDIDVLASVPDEFEGYRTLVVDCKSGKRESPITRALWLRGVMDHVRATRGLCLLVKEKIEPDHRYNAAQLGVLLLAEDEFEKYALATGARVETAAPHMAQIELWERFFDIATRYRALAESVQFSTSGFWMSSSESEACRRCIAEAVRIRPEVDPSKREHIALIFDLSALFMHSLSRLVAKLFASYLQPDNRDELSQALLTLLYGGRENYEHLNALKKLIASASPNVQNGKSLTLPEWDRFLQLVRHGLDSPIELPYAALLLRELAWSFLAEQPNLGFATLLSAEKRQAAKMALLGAEYISHAGKLPPEFVAIATKTLLGLQQPPSQPALSGARV
jgi:hypothetical protein